jgi:hypothetical protein
MPHPRILKAYKNGIIERSQHLLYVGAYVPQNHFVGGCVGKILDERCTFE